MIDFELIKYKVNVQYELQDGRFAWTEVQSSKWYQTGNISCAYTCSILRNMD